MFCIRGAGQISAHSIEKELHTFVFKGATAEHRHDFHLQSGSAESAVDFFLGDRIRIVEILEHQFFVEFSDGFKHFVAILLALIEHVFGNIFQRVVCAHRFIVVVNSFHAHEVDHTLESVFSADRELDRARICTKNLARHFEEVGT